MSTPQQQQQQQQQQQGGILPPLPGVSLQQNQPPMPPPPQGAPPPQMMMPQQGAPTLNQGVHVGNLPPPNNNMMMTSGRGDGRGNYASNRDGKVRGGRGNYPPNNNNMNQRQQQQQRPPTNANDIFDVPYGFLPAYLPGAASMVEQLDRRLLVILRDGRHLVGKLRSFDQFSNMVLQETCERRILVVKQNDNSTICYQTDIDLGLFIVRGDNVVLLGEVGDDDEEEHEDDDNNNNQIIRFVSLEEFEQLEDEEYKKKEESGNADEEPINWDFDQDLVA